MDLGDLRSRDGFGDLNQDEVAFCANNHVTPRLLLRARKDLIDKSQSSVVTIYDVRLISSLDLLRSQALYEFLIEQRHLPVP